VPILVLASVLKRQSEATGGTASRVNLDPAASRIVQGLRRRAALYVDELPASSSNSHEDAPGVRATVRQCRRTLRSPLTVDAAHAEVFDFEEFFDAVF
jgi:hypothetical protein